MSIVRETYDVAALAASMLDGFKVHVRVDHDDDDQYLQDTLGRAIAQIERRSGISIAPQTFRWIPKVEELGSQFWLPLEERLSLVPVFGVADFTADRGGVDVSDQYTLVGDVSPNAFAQLRLVRPGGLYAGDVIMLEAGFETAAEVPPEVEDVIYRYGAYLYEFRESSAASSVTSQMPEWFNEALGTLWAPRV